MPSVSPVEKGRSSSISQAAKCFKTLSLWDRSWDSAVSLQDSPTSTLHWLLCSHGQLVPLRLTEHQLSQPIPVDDLCGCGQPNC